MNHRKKILACMIIDLQAFKEGNTKWLFTKENELSIVKPSLKSLCRKATIVFSSFSPKEKVKCVHLSGK